MSELVHCTIWITNELPTNTYGEKIKHIWRVPVLSQWFLLRSTDKLLTTLYLRFACDVGYAAKRSVLPSFSPVPSVVYQSKYPAHRRAFSKSLHRRTPEKSNVTVVENPGKFLCSWLRRQKNQARKGTFNWGNSLGRDLFSEYCFLHLSFVPTCEIIFVHKYQLFIHEDCQHPVFIHELLTFIVCLNTLPFVLLRKGKEKKTLLFYRSKTEKKKIFIHPLWKRVPPKALITYVKESVQFLDHLRRNQPPLNKIIATSASE